MPTSLLAILLADKPSHREINKLKLASLKMPILHTHCGLGEPTGSAALGTLGPIAKLKASKIGQLQVEVDFFKDSCDKLGVSIPEDELR
jgi:hypothetical protein